MSDKEALLQKIEEKRIELNKCIDEKLSEGKGLLHKDILDISRELALLFIEYRNFTKNQKNR